MQSVPVYLTLMIEFFLKHNLPTLSRLRSMDIGGERVPGPMIDRLLRSIVDDARVWNLYGPAETTIDSTYYLVERTSDKTTKKTKNVMKSIVIMLKISQRYS